MKNKLIKRAFILLLFFIFISTIISCATLFKKNGANTFEYYTLTNGIPLIVYQNNTSNVSSLQIVVEGGSALLEPEYSGLENSVFEMLSSGSKHYSAEYIKQILYDTQGSMFSSSNEIASVLGLVSIDYYFDSLLPILIDSFLNPIFTASEFETHMRILSQELQYSLNDPNAFLNKTVLEERYSNHPFETRPNVTQESLKNITVVKMKEHLIKIHNASKITIVAVGDLDGEKLVSVLNKEIGQLEKKEYNPIKIPPASTGGQAIIKELEGAQDSGYVTYTVPAPKPGGNDEIAMRLASDIYSEILFNVVREQYGATYSIASSYSNSLAPYVTVKAYKVSDLENLSTYILEAESLMKRNTIISGKNTHTNEFEYTTIEERLEGYKNSLINTQFNTSQTNAGISAMIINSLLMYDDPEYYLNFTARVQQTSAQDVKNAFNTYFLSEKQWFAITGIGQQEEFKY